MIIGVTGYISSGKTTLLSHVNYKVLKADDMVSKLHETYSKEVYDIIGTNDKKEILEIIMSNKEKKDELESFFSKLISIKLTEFKYRYKDQIIFFEAANIFELGLDEYVSEVIFIDTSKNKCVINALKKRKYSLKTILKIINNQLRREKYLELCKYSFVTSTNLDNDNLRFNKFIDILVGNR